MSEAVEFLKNTLEVNINTAMTDDLRQLFQDELDLLLKAAEEKPLNDEYVQGCWYRLFRTLNAIALMN